MAFDTLTAITELVKTNLNKFVPNKMSESEKANLATDMERLSSPRLPGETPLFDLLSWTMRERLKMSPG